MRAVCLDSLCLTKTVVIKYSVARMQIYNSTRYMFLNHCLYLNIHPLPFNPIAIVLLQGGFPGPLLWLVSVHWRMRHQFKCNLIETLDCACTMYSRVWDSGSSCFVFHWWGIFITTIHLFSHETEIQANHSIALHFKFHQHWSFAITYEGRLFERSYLSETRPQLGTKRQL